MLCELSDESNDILNKVFDIIILPILKEYNHIVLNIIFRI